jgi:hypothetical protein
MPQRLQKRCSITCLLNRYTLLFASGVERLNCARGTNHILAAFRWHMEQLHSITPCSSPSTV